MNAWELVSRAKMGDVVICLSRERVPTQFTYCGHTNDGRMASWHLVNRHGWESNLDDVDEVWIASPRTGLTIPDA